MKIDLPWPAKGAWTPEQIATLKQGYELGELPKDIASKVNRTPAAVRNKAYELKLTHNRAWSADEVEALRTAYASHPMGIINLDAVAEKVGRDRMAVALKASKLGLGDQARKRVEERKDRRSFKGDQTALSEFQSARSKAMIAENGHPRGFAGRKHSASTKAVISEKSKAANAARTAEERSAIAMKAVKTSAANGRAWSRGSWKAGWREIGGKNTFYRSRWEANYARYLEWLKSRGEIKDWAHEPETFWFESIKRGVRSYKPDFRIWENDGSAPLHEVKGWMDARSKTAIKRLRKYYPQETLVVIKEREYMAIARKVHKLIPCWEIDGKGRL
mgnify:CR=1 FL=1